MRALSSTIALAASCGEAPTEELPTQKQAAYYAGVDEGRFGVCQFDVATEQCVAIVFLNYGADRAGLSLPQGWFIDSIGDDREDCRYGRRLSDPDDGRVSGTGAWDADAFLFPKVVELDLQVSTDERDPITIRGTINVDDIGCNYAEGGLHDKPSVGR